MDPLPAQPTRLGWHQHRAGSLFAFVLIAAAAAAAAAPPRGQELNLEAAGVDCVVGRGSSASTIQTAREGTLPGCRLLCVRHPRCVAFDVTTTFRLPDACRLFAEHHPPRLGAGMHGRRYCWAEQDRGGCRLWGCSCACFVEKFGTKGSDGSDNRSHSDVRWGPQMRREDVAARKWWRDNHCHARLVIDDVGKGACNAVSRLPVQTFDRLDNLHAEQTACDHWGCSCQGFSDRFGTGNGKWGMVLNNWKGALRDLELNRQWWRDQHCETTPGPITGGATGHVATATVLPQPPQAARHPRSQRRGKLAARKRGGTTSIVNAACVDQYFGTEQWTAKGSTQPLERYWNRARQAAGMGPLPDTELSAYFHSRDHFLSGQRYRRVYKCANNNLRENLLQSCMTEQRGRKMLGLPPKGGGWIGPGKLGELRALVNNPNNTLLTYTFVREPLAHFVSGYREAVQGVFNECCNSTWPASAGEIAFLASAEVGGSPNHRPCLPSREVLCLLYRDPVKLARHFMRALLDTELSSWYWVHIYPMVNWVYTEGTLGAVRMPDFIGRLEHVNEDWSRMCTENPGYCPEQYLRPEGTRQFARIAGHPAPIDKTLASEARPLHDKSSRDALGAGKGLSKLFEDEPALLAAIKVLLEPDAACFAHLYTDN